MYTDRGPATSLITRYSTRRALVAFNKHDVIPAGTWADQQKGCSFLPRPHSTLPIPTRRRRPTKFCAVGQSIFSQKLHINRRGHTGRRLSGITHPMRRRHTKHYLRLKQTHFFRSSAQTMSVSQRIS